MTGTALEHALNLWCKASPCLRLRVSVLSPLRPTLHPYHSFDEALSFPYPRRSQPRLCRWRHRRCCCRLLVRETLRRRSQVSSFSVFLHSSQPIPYLSSSLHPQVINPYLPIRKLTRIRRKSRPPRQASPPSSATSPTYPPTRPAPSSSTSPALATIPSK